MPVRDLPSPVDPLYRIGRAPDPLAWPPWEFVGAERFDDPARRYRVLYTGERAACFLETLANFRPSLTGVVERNLTSDWLVRRRVARFSLADPSGRHRWLDLRAPETHQVLRREFARLLMGLNVTDFDISAATSGLRRLTQGIGSWAYDGGYHGIVYCSRFDPHLTCWTVFERVDGPVFHDADVQPIRRSDPDLVHAANLFGLSIP